MVIKNEWDIEMSYFELDFFRGEVQRKKGKKSMPRFGGIFSRLCTEFLRSLLV